MYGIYLEDLYAHEKIILKRSREKWDVRAWDKLNWLGMGSLQTSSVMNFYKQAFLKDSWEHVRVVFMSVHACGRKVWECFVTTNISLISKVQLHSIETVWQTSNLLISFNSILFYQNNDIRRHASTLNCPVRTKDVSKTRRSYANV